ncbi:MAG: MBL fold metallo-hydrolase [Rhodospirillaceae bacterium]|jgi:phosphoribosyl 1,2-cyclic phosphodiesterase|nr:MBL fold metallo-hydrolase [Rhodospirillaceae bacterium]MBT5193300.1 MBL fold metallo-hydrolase [Rhodospirillaceae bacterium]MBT5897642.1 MBL fold metallo-hydrolase [Rhodospirillaceae bacterium]MBT6426417.1 MBL fold metallo-hydrolase [Rhodospirillaceae bacterium]MBT7759280.1 MBL fold metallo-hydrolase [Rhodospirillaceae bacterium]
MSETNEFQVRFWGVRGSISISDPKSVRYGGNTSCLEVRCGDRLLIFDAGSGLRYLGNEMMAGGETFDTDIFLTHTHYDHICGIPFFKPFFNPQNKFRLWAGHLLPETDLRGVLCALMKSPLFPVPLEIFQSKIEFHDFLTGDNLSVGDDVVVRTASLNHPDGATGYRVEYGGQSICYLTDTEHVAGELDQTILELIDGADIVIYDSMFTEEEYKNCVGWGHSTWEAGADLCDAANVPQFVIFHHDPDHDDEFMDKIAEAAERRRPGTIVAREGMVLRPARREAEAPLLRRRAGSIG